MGHNSNRSKYFACFLLNMITGGDVILLFCDEMLKCFRLRAHNYDCAPDKKQPAKNLFNGY